MPAFLIPLDPGGSVIPLEKAIVLVGRQADCDVVITHSRKVSRKHCCFAQVNDKWIIRDLGSTNGVAINGARIRKEHRLRLGDEVMVGDVRFQLHNRPSLTDNRGVETAGQTPAMRASATSPVSSELPFALPESGVEIPAYSIASQPDSPPPLLSPRQPSRQEQGSDKFLVDSSPRPEKEPPHFENLFARGNDDELDDLDGSGIDLNPRSKKHRDGSRDRVPVSSDSFG